MDAYGVVMALQKTVITEHGATAEYHKIMSIRDVRSVPEVTVFVHVFKDASCKNLKPMLQKTYVFNNEETEVAEDEWVILRPYFLSPDEVNPEGENHIKLSYDALKLLPEYEGAIDV